MQQFDYVIVGAGSAGCVMANRLSADPGVRVLLIEAGGNERGLMSRIPAGTFRLMGNPRYDWGYVSEPDPTIHGRRLQFNAGRMLGGSSAINGMVYIRGLRSDYARWGLPGWSFDELLPYFMLAQNYAGEAHPMHGRDGPLSVSPAAAFHPLAEAFLGACEEIGAERRSDYSGGEQLGAFKVLGTTRRGRRWSTARAYLNPARSRSNLTIATNVTVDRLVFLDRRATGVAGRRDGQAFSASARRAVIVSGGTIASPALLQRSGIGAAEDLQAIGVASVSDLHGVGRNLREHAAVNISKFVNVPTYNVQMGPFSLARAFADFLIRGRGMLTTTAVQAMANFKTKPDLPDPDVTLHFVPVLTDFRDSRPTMHKRAGAKIGVSINRPHASGTVQAISADATTKPKISYQLLADRRDIDTLVDGCILIEKLYATTRLSGFILENHRPAPPPSDREGWADFVRTFAHTGYHPIGTCKMGTVADAEAVVDTDLRVRGVEGLYVVDGSVIPQPISANTNATIIAVAEKAAKVIMQQFR